MARPRYFSSAISLLFLGAIATTYCYDCSYVNNENWCSVSGVKIQSTDDIAIITFPNVSLISLNQPTIDYLSPEVLERMISVDEMEIDSGTVHRIYVKPTLSRLSAHKNQAYEVTIDPVDNYNLEHLGVAYNRLRFIPENIRFLKHLVRLYLHDNEIETIDMDLLKNLTRLRVLALHRNKIHRVDTTVALKLTNLAEFHLYGNQLEELYVTLWDFPNLKMFNLASNKFRSIGHFPEHFPRLMNAALGGNRWNCAWLVHSVGPVLMQGDIKLTGDKQCLDSKLAGICCDGKPEDFGGYLAEFMNEQFQRMNVWMIRQQRSMEAIEGEIQSVRNEQISANVENKAKYFDLELQIGKFEESVNKNLMNLRRDLQRIERNNPKQVLQQFEWFKEKLAENRALIDDIIQDMYFEEMRKNGINV